MRNDSVLIVDDQEVNRYLLAKIFSDYRILEATNGNEALAIIEKEKKNIDIILLDIVMPVADGFTVLDKLKSNGLIKKIPVVMITGDTSVEVQERGFDMGVADFITKPFEQKIVRKRVDNAIDLYMYKNKLELLVKKQTEKLALQTQKVKDSQNQIIDTLSSVVEFRNLESGDHIKRIRKFTAILARCVQDYYKEYNLTEEKVSKITSAAMMHDVGKIAVPDNILLKPGRLTPDEFEVMKTHTTKGCEIINNIRFIDDKEFFDYCYDICRHHHEKYDGKGYPDGLRGEDIPIAAQIVSIADVYDALVSERVYKKAYSHDKAYEMILEGECGMFNPKLLECFKLLKDDFKAAANN